MPKLDTTFVVICRSDSTTVEHSGEVLGHVDRLGIITSERTEQRYVAGHYELATRRVFTNEDEAQTFARTINHSREPLVIPGDWMHLRTTAVPDEEELARFTHDCSTCVYLGRTKADADASEGHDLYFHKDGHVTVIARFGSEGPDYISGLPLADKMPALAEAKRRAVARGLLTP